MSAPETTGKEAAVPAGSITPAPALAHDALKAAVLAAAEQATPRQATGSPLPPDVLQNLDRVEQLNNVAPGKPGWWRRIQRKQGRINRLMVEALCTVLEAVNLPDAHGADNKVARAADCFRHARELNHASRGGALWKRIRRQQQQFNASFADGLDTLVQRVFPAPPEDSVAREQHQHISWHLQEARFLNGRPKSGPQWLRRIRRNQGEINRCHIIAAKLLLPYAVR